MRKQSAPAVRIGSPRTEQTCSVDDKSPHSKHESKSDDKDQYPIKHVTLLW